MKKIVFITGSVRSGKSDFAVKLAKQWGKDVIFLATCKPADNEMRKRVKKHKKSRPGEWKVIEENIDISSVIKNTKKDKLVIIDCITLWVSSLLLSGLKEKKIIEKINEFTDTLKKTKLPLVIVSNEVGWGIVPDNEISRIFRDIIGIAHQKISKVSQEVYLLVSGIALKIKG